MKVKKIWLEFELWEDELDSKNENSDVIVDMEDGSRWSATFFTYDNIQWLASKNKETGECLNGKYFWAPNMCLIDEMSRARVEELVEYLIKEDEFESIFYNADGSNIIEVKEKKEYDEILKG